MIDEDSDRRRRRRLIFGAKVLLSAVLAITIYIVLAEPITRIEGNAVMSAASTINSDIERAPSDGAAIVTAPQGSFAVRFVTSCSVAALVAALVPVCLLLIRAPLQRRLLALAIGLLVVMVVNATRVITVVLAGAHYGEGAMVAFHDWAGTMLSAATGLIGLAVMLKISLYVGRGSAQLPGDTPT